MEISLKMYCPQCIILFAFPNSPVHFKGSLPAVVLPSQGSTDDPF